MSPSFIGCTFAENEATHQGGVLYFRDSTATFTDCIVAFNRSAQYAVQCFDDLATPAGSVPFFECCNIYGNAGSQLYNGNESGSYPLYAAQCYWGTADKAAVSKLIVDGKDNPLLGEVTFDPILAAPFELD